MAFMKGLSNFTGLLVRAKRLDSTRSPAVSNVPIPSIENRIESSHAMFDVQFHGIEPKTGAS